MMYPARIRPNRRKFVLVLALALWVGLPTPAQGYLLHPAVFIAYAPGTPSRPPLAESDPKGIGVSRMGDPDCQREPTHTVLNRILNFPTGPLADYVTNVASAAYKELFGGLSPQGSLPLLSGVFADKPDCLLVYSGISGATVDGAFDHGFAGSFASAAGSSGTAMTPSGNLLHHLAPFSSTLVLLGSGLMGLAGLGYRRRRG